MLKTLEFNEERRKEFVDLLKKGADLESAIIEASGIPKAELGPGPYRVVSPLQEVLFPPVESGGGVNGTSCKPALEE